MVPLVSSCQKEPYSMLNMNAYHSYIRKYGMDLSLSDRQTDGQTNEYECYTFKKLYQPDFVI